MIMNSMWRSICAAVFAICMSVGISSPSSAAMIFSGSFTVDSHNSDPGLMIGTDPAEGTSGSVGFSLGLGESTTFDLFDIWANESDVSAGEDTVPQAISVAFTFTAPPGTATATGQTNGELSGYVFGFPTIQSASVEWSNPTIFDFGTGILEIALSNETFSSGLFGLCEEGDLLCQPHGTVKMTATLTELAPVSTVPLPAALPLMATALAGFGVVRLRRRRAA